tara:strand:+ start:1173 stop:1505 length:333 start_codon:yes stop_codon:yes gene_type:complete
MACTPIPVYDFSLIKGDDYTLTFKCKEEDNPTDLTDHIIQLESNIPSLKKTATITNATEGEFEITFAKADTETLLNKRVKYKLVFYPTGLTGNKSTKFWGSINIATKDII